jgi:predicted component of type VI protein secretion system
MPKLQFVLPDGTETRYSLEGETFKIGRAPDNDIVLSDPRVSSHHLVLTRIVSGAFIAHDLGATNPTRINGRPSPLHELKDGDTLLLGDTYAKYESDAAPAARPQVAPAGRAARSNATEPAVPGRGCFAMLVVGALGMLGVCALALHLA